MTYGGLFEGIGMFAYAAEKAGITPIWSNEIDPFCCDVLRKNFNHKIIQNDIKQVKETELEAVDIICGGFPCTDISVAGNRTGITGKKSSLWEHQFRIISNLRPRYALIENSPNLRKEGLFKILSQFASIGYDAEWSRIPASLYGLPHERSRMFILAYPHTQRGRCRLHNVIVRRRKEFETKERKELDSLRDSFLQFSESIGESAVFRMDDEYTHGLDKASIRQFRRRLNAVGNAIVWNIAFDIIEEIKRDLI